MHRFDRAVTTVVTGLHAVNAVDMVVRCMSYYISVRPDTHTPTRNPMPYKLIQSIIQRPTYLERSRKRVFSELAIYVLMISETCHPHAE